MGAVKELWQRSQEQAHEQFGWLAGDEWFVESYGNAERALFVVSDRAIYLLLPGGSVPARTFPLSQPVLV